MRKLALVSISVLLTIYLSYCQGLNESSLNKSVTSLKVRVMKGLFIDQFEINPNYCISNKSEISMGIYYRYSEFNSLISFKSVLTPVTFYGLKFGYIPNIKREKKVCIRWESNLAISLIYTKIIYNETVYTSFPVFAGTLFFGPNLKIQITNEFDLCFTYKLGIGIGTNSSTSFTSVNTAGSEIFGVALPFMDLQYKF